MGEKELQQNQPKKSKETKPQASKETDAAEATAAEKERKEESSEVEEGPRRDPNELIAEIRSVLSPSTMSVEAKIIQLRESLLDDDDDFDIDEFLRGRMERRVPPPDPTQDYSLTGAPKVKEIDENDQSLVDPWFSDKEVDKWMLLNLRKRYGIRGRKQELEWRKKYIETKALFKKMSDDLHTLKQMLARYPARPTKEQTSEIVNFIETKFPQTLLLNPFISDMMQGSMLELENALPKAQRLLFREFKKISETKKLGLTDEQLWDRIPKYSIADATKHYLGTVFQNDATLKATLERLRADAISQFGPKASQILTDEFLLGEIKKVADGEVNLMSPAIGTELSELASKPTATPEEKQLAEDLKELERRAGQLENAKPEWWDDEIQNFAKYSQEGERTAGPLTLKPSVSAKIMEDFGLTTKRDPTETHRPATDPKTNLAQAKTHFRTRLTLYEAESKADIPETTKKMQEFIALPAPEDEDETVRQEALLSDIYASMENEREKNKEKEPFEPRFVEDDKKNWEEIAKNDTRAREILSSPNVTEMAKKYDLDPFGIVQKKLEEAYLNYFYLVAKMELDEIEDKKIEMEKGEIGPHVHQIAERRMVRRIKKYFLDWAAAVQQDEVEERRAVFELRAKRKEEAIEAKAAEDKLQQNRKQPGYWKNKTFLGDSDDEYDGSDDEPLSAKDLEDEAEASEESSEDEQPTPKRAADSPAADSDGSDTESDSEKLSIAEKKERGIPLMSKDLAKFLISQQKKSEEDESDVDAAGSGNLAKDLLGNDDIDSDVAESVASEPDERKLPISRITDADLDKDYDENDLYKEDLDPVAKETKKYIKRVRALQVLEEDTEEYKHYYDRIQKIVTDVLDLKEQAPMVNWEPILDTESDLSDYDSEMDVAAGTPDHKRYKQVELGWDTDEEALESCFHGVSKDQAFLRLIERRIARRRYALQRKAERKATLEKLKSEDPAKYIEEMNADFKKKQEKSKIVVQASDDLHIEPYPWERCKEGMEGTLRQEEERKEALRKALEAMVREDDREAATKKERGWFERKQQLDERRKEHFGKWATESEYYDKLEEEKYARRGAASPWQPKISTKASDNDLLDDDDDIEDLLPGRERETEEIERKPEKPMSLRHIKKMSTEELIERATRTKERKTRKRKDEAERELEEVLEKVAEKDEQDADSLNLDWTVDVESVDKQFVIDELGIQPSERICFEKAWMQVVKDQREDVIRAQNSALEDIPIAPEEEAKHKAVFDKMYELMYHPKEEGGEIEPMVWRDINGDPENPPLQSQILHAYRLLAAKQYRMNHGLRVQMAKIREHKELPDLSLPKKLPEDTKFNRDLTEQKFTEFKTMVDQQAMLPATRHTFMRDMRTSLIKVSKASTKQSELPTLHLRYLKDKAIKEKKEREEKRRLALRAQQQAEAGLRA